MLEKASTTTPLRPHYARGWAAAAKGGDDGEWSSGGGGVGVGERENAASEAFGTILRAVGEGGRYQWATFGVASFCGLIFAMNNLAAAFLAATPEFRCNSSTDALNNEPFKSVFLNDTLYEFTDDHHESFLKNTSAIGGAEISACEYYTVSENRSSFESAPSPFERHECRSWIYDDSIYKSTIVTEWDLVCRKRWMMTSAQATYMAGVLVGAVVLSELSDLYGRRTIVLVSAVGFLACGVCVTFTSHFLAFIVLRFLVACFGSGMFLPSFVLVMEMSGPSIRPTMGMLFQCFFAVGFCLIPGIAYLIRDWRMLQLAISVPSVLHLLYFKILPESPLWLLSQGRQSEALTILKKMARVNNTSLPDEKELQELLSRITKHSHGSKTFLGKIANFFKNQVTLVRTRIMRRRCLIMYFSWFVVSMVYYGLTFSGANIDASVYLMVFLSGIVEIPAYLIACFTIKIFGRRINISACFIVCGIACMLILAVPKDMVWLNVTLASTGKLFNSVAFAVAYIFSAELVPTKVRNIAVGTSSMWARVGSTIAPFIVDSLGQIHYAIPSTVFGILSIMAGLLDLLLPETGKSPLPETIEEVEALKR